MQCSDHWKDIFLRRVRSGGFPRALYVLRPFSTVGYPPPQPPTHWQDFIVNPELTSAGEKNIFFRVKKSPRVGHDGTCLWS